MIATPLQLTGLRIGILFGVGLSLVSAILGIVITYIAYQGYKRNGSRPMFFVAIGFFLVFVIPFVLALGPGLIGFLIVRTGRFSEFAPFFARASAILGIIAEVSGVIGLVSILYGLRMPLRQ